MSKSKIAKRRSKSRKNPDSMKLAYQVGAGFAGYTATRLFTRLAFAQAVKKFGDKPSLARHAAFVASAAGATGAYFGSKKWDKLSDYHEEITIGAGIALAQTFVQSYLPQFSWIVGDMTPEQYAPKKVAQEPVGTVSTVPSLMGVPDEVPSLPEPSEPEFDLDALMAEHGLEEGEQIGQLPPTSNGSAEDPLDQFGLGSLGDYNEAHELH